MKEQLLKTVIAACVLSINTYAQNKPQETIIIEGQYAGKNLVIKNSFGPGGVGYCVTETKVNGKITKDEINANIFQIDLAALSLKAGDNVKIEIFYLKGCAPLSKPLIIDPTALMANDVFMLEGTYKWQNLFVINPKTAGGRFSITEVAINGKAISTKTDTDIFEIKLQAMNFKENEKIKVEFKYAKDFGPILINPEALN